MMLENNVSVRMGIICDMVLMVEIYEKDMGVIIVKYYDTMAQAALNNAFHSR